MLGRLSLQERVVVLVIVAVLPLLALPVWFAVHQARAVTDLFQSQLKFAASLIATNQDRRVEAAEHLLGAISAMPEMRAPERKVCEKYFEALRGRYPIYANIGVFDTQGNVACHAQGRVGDFNASERGYFKRALAERGFVMGAPVMGKVSERWVIPFARPVFDGERITGVAFATLDLGHAAAALDAADLPAGARLMVTNRHGVLLMERPAGNALAPGSIVQNPLLLEAARAMQAGTALGRSAGDEQRLYAYAPGRVVSGEGFFAVVSIDSAEVSRASTAALRTVLVALLAALLPGLAAAWWVGGRVIVKPAKQILGTVRRLEQGRLDARVPMDSAGAPRGEFARIGAAFNLMADSLQVRQRNLEAELGRSRSAYEALDLVLNSMQDALVAVTASGQFLMFNEAATRLLPLDGPPLLPRQWPEAFGFFHADGRTPYEVDEMPLVRSARGESGRQPLLFVRNARVPEGRMLQCSWQPIGGEGGITGGLVVFTDVTELERLQAEQAAQFEQLRETQRKLIEAQRIGRVGNWELDLETGRLWWSQEVYGLFGVPQEGFVPTLEAVERLVHPDDRALLKPARDAALRDGQAVNLEYRAIKPDGAVAWMHEIGEPRLDAHGAPVWFGGVVQDVTERKRVEQALLDSERELQDYTLMLQRAAEAAQRIMAHSTVDATLQEVVDQARHVIGARHAAVALTSHDPAEPVAHSAAGDSGEVSAAVGYRLSVPLASRDGRPIGRLEISGKEGAFTERDEYVLLELAQLGSIAIENARLFTQIRELNAGLEARIAERTAELTRQEQLYRTLAEQAPEVIWNTDAEGRATFLNHAWYELVGGVPGDWLGHGWLGRVHPDDVAEVQQNWLRSRDTLQPYVGIRRVLGRDGRYHTMSYKAAPVLDEHGNVAFWVGIDADITEFKAIERALRNSNQELEAFSYSVSHDLRAPLGAIAGFSKALAGRLEDAEDDERARHYLARIQAGVEKMEQLIDALLGLAKVARAPLNYGPVDMSGIARETLEGLQMQYPQRRVEPQVQDALVAQGDARLLRIVLENLLANAWKFTSQCTDARIEVGRVESGNVFYVRDNGVGFDMAYAGKLFGAFQRLHTEAEFPGTGIGLATVRRIVARHQGRAWAESVPGEGTTFYFALSETAPPAWLADDPAG